MATCGSYVNTGQIDRAEPLFLRAREDGEHTAEVAMELANLALNLMQRYHRAVSLDVEDAAALGVFVAATFDRSR